MPSRFLSLSPRRRYSSPRHLAQSGRPMTIHDLARRDSRRASRSSRRTAGRSPTCGRRRIWRAGSATPTSGLVPADGGAAEALIAGDKTENTPRWSPDGKRSPSSRRATAIRRSSSRTPTAAASGRSDHLPGGVQPPLVFSPDGTLLAFVSDVYPDCADEACNRQRREAAEKNPVKVHAPDAPAVPPLGRVARERPPSRVRRGPSPASAARDVTPGRLRLAAGPGRRRRRSRSRPTARRSRSSRTAKATIAKPGRRTTTCGWCRSAGGAAKKLTPNPAADAQPVVHARRQVDDRARPAARRLRVRSLVSRRPTIARAARSARSSKRRISRSATTSLSPDGRAIFFVAPSNGARQPLPRAAGRRHAEARREGRRGRAPRRSGETAFVVLEVVDDGAGRGRSACRRRQAVDAGR